MFLCVVRQGNVAMHCEEKKYLERMLSWISSSNEIMKYNGATRSNSVFAIGNVHFMGMLGYIKSQALKYA